MHGDYTSHSDATAKANMACWVAPGPMDYASAQWHLPHVANAPTSATLTVWCARSMIAARFAANSSSLIRVAR
jgi:hypothetical protein